MGSTAVVMGVVSSLHLLLSAHSNTTITSPQPLAAALCNEANSQNAPRKHMHPSHPLPVVVAAMISVASKSLLVHRLWLATPPTAAL